MKNTHKKTMMVIALISVVLCGCPGCALLLPGINLLTESVGPFVSLERLAADLANGFFNGGWMLCLGGVFLLIPLVLLIIALVVRSQKGQLEALEPTGVSRDDPIPPTS